MPESASMTNRFLARNFFVVRSEKKGGVVNSDYVLMGAAVAILGFLWQLHRDMSGMKERLAGVEATLAIIVNGLQIQVKGKDMP